ncbi:MAG TPA: biotin/lipoate A/B protein ligase family protein [Candidatus Methylacidiphilales bacterium]|jgi:lipoate-protein ligase A|nr:biotin/lipoate A/B protein ligase family protein [Candidatus Methylacidiphilales bacterium]
MPLWRLLIHGAGSPAHNMAVDEALLRLVREPVLRVYEWSVPAVSLGYFQPASLAGERPFVRRYTGGGLVDHAQDVTYTIVLPRAHPWMEMSAPESYCHIHRGVQAALAACGIVSELTPAAHAVESDACFAKPVKFDIVAPTGKLSGAAQRRTREGLLHQGSILLPDPARNADLRAGFAKAFAARLELFVEPGELTTEESTRAAELERERYATDAWNRSR